MRILSLDLKYLPIAELMKQYNAIGRAIVAVESNEPIMTYKGLYKFLETGCALNLLNTMAAECFEEAAKRGYNLACNFDAGQVIHNVLDEAKVKVTKEQLKYEFYILESWLSKHNMISRHRNLQLLKDTKLPEVSKVYTVIEGPIDNYEIPDSDYKEHIDRLFGGVLWIMESLPRN